MEEITRAQIHDKIKELVKTNTDKSKVSDLISKWLDTTKCSDFDKKQILRDLTSYKEYLEL